MDFVPQIVVVVILILWSGALTYLFWRLQSSLQTINRGGKKENIVELLREVLIREQKIEHELADTNHKVEGLLFDSQFYIQKIGLVRFNPFNDTGGDQSFILSLVDEKNSGVVVSGLHTRNGTRWYAKQVHEGKGVEHELSSDELKAIKAATKRIRNK
ncbi:MAG: DUF4446 family protein [Candidatus Levybacteria bacterium]|nr:DUF4446 family protein [Candidatus Levybacteria bacterium]